MMYTIRFHPLVREDYEEAYEWYEDKEQGLGERFLKVIRTKIEAIALHPEYYSYKSNLSFREVRTDVFHTSLFIKSTSERKRFTSVLFIMQRGDRKENIVRIDLSYKVPTNRTF